VFRSALSLEFLIVCLNLDHKLLSPLKNVQRQVVIQRLLLHEEDVLQHVPISLISHDVFAFGEYLGFRLHSIKYHSEECFDGAFVNDGEVGRPLDLGLRFMLESPDEA